MATNVIPRGDTLAEKFIYKITVKNWSKYNSTMKKGHKKTFISNNFCDDAKLRSVPMTTRWLFLGVLVTCGDFGRDTVEMSSKRLRDLLESNRNIDGALDSLQSLQIVTYEKITLFTNRIEKKRREKKGIEVNKAPTSAALTVVAPVEILDLPKLIWQSYEKAYLARYAISPKRNVKVNSQIKQLAQRLGADAPAVVEFYLQSGKTYYVSKTHEIGCCLYDAETLYTQWQKGHAITNGDLRRFEKLSESAELDRLIDEGKI